MATICHRLSRYRFNSIRFLTNNFFYVLALIFIENLVACNHDGIFIKMFFVCMHFVTHSFDTSYFEFNVDRLTFVLHIALLLVVWSWL